MLRGLDCVQRMPSRSQYSQNNPRMSADREEVPRVLVLGDAPARQLRPEAVRRAAPVGVDEPAQELARVAVDDVALPGLEDDRAEVLGPGAVLRERLEPGVAEGLDPHAVVVAPGYAWTSPTA
jgi:hypothetical protein